ncbi:hypothetical protein [Arvimicrobium flavum]|uniref:hypothetical protein n=1 Tax=Arvimicrobium flavum TaxID=3393320 RepID=UPI00237B4221|nr:hypothetical protein [Mesorhizobium shangrilense]
MTDAQTLALALHDWRLADGYDTDLTAADRQPWPTTIRIRADRFDVSATAPDGRNREIWIEIDKGELVAHCYDPDHDEPLSVRIGATSIAVDDAREPHAVQPPALPVHAAAAEET